MGYCYDNKMRLCCDLCGRSGGVRKHRCPHGYCPSLALCNDCKKLAVKDGRWKAAHVNCKASHEAFAARENKVAELKISGAFVRCSAMSQDDGSVLVLFEGLNHQTIGRYMSHETYDAIPLGEPATPEDYAKFGAVTEGPGEYYTGRTTKQCSVEEILEGVPA